jgi:hypothetical protein
MQRGQQYPPPNPVSPFPDGGYNRNSPFLFPSLFGQTNLPSGANAFMPFHNVEIQPSNVCPRNFIIFDQTDNRSQIMFHPTVAPKFFNPGLSNLGQYNVKFNSTEQEKEKPKSSSSFLKENSDDIDALMSLDYEDEEYEDEDDDEVSTARTYGNCGGDSADSGPTRALKHRKRAISSCSEKSGSEMKRLKMKKMVKTLRGILPGGKDMNAVDVLDEAVKYLKSLKVEVHKLGIGNINIKN